jgi:hypothetical protein
MFNKQNNPSFFIMLSIFLVHSFVNGFQGSPEILPTACSTVHHSPAFSSPSPNQGSFPGEDTQVFFPLASTHTPLCRWLNMERKFAFEKVDNLFMTEGNSVWESEIGEIA